MQLSFQLVTPERVLLDESVDSLTCPTVEGQITILPQHEPLVAILQHGELVVHVKGENRHVAVAGGFVEVRPGNMVVILADDAVHAEEIDVQEAEAAIQRAEQLMKHGNIPESEMIAARQEHLRYTARLNVARKARHANVALSSQGVLKE